MRSKRASNFILYCNADCSWSDEFFQTGNMFNASTSSQLNQVSPQFSPDVPFDNPEWYVYTTGGFQSSESTLIAPQDTQSPRTMPGDSLMLNDPWDSQNGQVSNYQLNANPGIVAFEPPRGEPYETHIARQDYLDTGQMSNGIINPQQPISPTV